VSINEQLPPPPGQQYYQQAPPPPQRTSGLAIAGFILAIVVAPIGFVLSLIAVFKTGAGKAKGKGLAIAGIIISLVIMAGTTVLIIAAANSTVADPGCIDGKNAIINNSATINEQTLQKTVDELNAAAAKAKHDDVKAAVQAVADDYKQMLTAVKTGQVPPNLLDKVSADGAKLDSLCTIGG
jgi:hypothetical protein